MERKVTEKNLKKNIIYFWAHRKEHPYFEMTVALYVSIISFILIMIGNFFISFPKVCLIVFLAPVYEEFLKFGAYFMFIVFYTDYKVSKNDKKGISAIYFLFIFLLLMLLCAIGDMMNPANTVSDFVFIFLQQFSGHFAFVVIGTVFLMYYYIKEIEKRLLAVLIIFSLILSITLHSITNQIYQKIYIGYSINNIVISQSIYLVVLSIVSLIFLLVFIRYKGKKLTKN